MITKINVSQMNHSKMKSLMDSLNMDYNSDFEIDVFMEIKKSLKVEYFFFIRLSNGKSNLMACKTKSGEFHFVPHMNSFTMEFKNGVDIPIKATDMTVDGILDKVSRFGMKSLNESELHFLESKK